MNAEESFEQWHMETFGYFTRMDNALGDQVRANEIAYLAGCAAQRETDARIADSVQKEFAGTSLYPQTVARNIAAAIRSQNTPATP